jgi:hypothetical protein
MPMQMQRPGSSQASVDPRKPSADVPVGWNDADGPMPMPMKPPGSSELSEDPHKPIRDLSTPEVEDPESAARIDAQVPFFELSDRISEVSEKATGGSVFSPRFEVQAGQLYVYWHGEVPIELGHLAADAAAQGIDVIILPAAHSLAALSEASRSVSKNVRNPSGLVVETNPDGSGLTVSFPGISAVGLAVAEKARAADQAAVLSAVADLVADGINVRFSGAHEIPVDFGRADDTPPYWGGAYTQTLWGNGSVCTNGFGMHAGAAYQYMLTAAHCMSWLDDTSVYNGQGASMGYSDYVAELAGAGYDLALIRITGDASVAPRIYHTGPTDPGFTSRTVVAASNGIPLNQGAEYCASAAVQGPTCAVYAGTQVWVCTAQCTYAITVSNPIRNIVCPGDSGGPVFYYQDGFGSLNITAAGIVKGGVTDPNNPQCSKSGYISVVRTALNFDPRTANQALIRS